MKQKQRLTYFEFLTEHRVVREARASALSRSRARVAAYRLQWSYATVRAGAQS